MFKMQYISDRRFTVLFAIISLLLKKWLPDRCFNNISCNKENKDNFSGKYQ